MPISNELSYIARIQPRYNYAVPAEARLAMNKNIRLSEKAGFWRRHIDGVDWFDTSIPNTSIRARIYRPKDRVNALPVVLYFHGGGFVIGDLDTEHPRCLEMCEKTDSIVVSVDYRLAPEHKFPKGFEDCCTSVDWIQGDEFPINIDKAKLAIVGCSAGGGLATSTTIWMKENGRDLPILLMLLYPVLDDRADYHSKNVFVNSPVWNSKDNEYMWEHYLGEKKGNSCFYAAPARYSHLEGLPSTYILTVECDPLRDEALSFGMRLLKAGVSTEIHNVAGAFHGFDSLGKSGVCLQARLEQYEVINKHLRRRAR